MKKGRCPMNCNILAQFRRQIYACFERAGDALMNLADALLTHTTAQSVPELSQSPCFERRWPSTYEGLQDAKINRNALQKVFATSAPLPPEGERLVLGGDASSILRIDSKTGRDRTYVHASNLPEDAKPIRPGWQFSELAVLPNERSSFVFLLDHRRIDSRQTQAEVMAKQLEEAVPRFLLRLLWLGDGYYGSQTFRSLTHNLDGDVLVRFAKNRVLYRDPPPRDPKPGPGHPTWDGPPFRIKDPTTHGLPDASWDGTDERGRRLEVRCWHNLHFQKVRQHKVTLIQVIRHGAADTKRDPKVSWFLFWGQQMPELADLPALYARRYNLEHGYRWAKQDLLWETPRLRTPEQFEHWTDVVSIVRNTLFLARDLVEAQRQSWESQCRTRTPQQVRRAMGRIMAQLGTPARPCRPRGYSPGWPSGRPRQPVPTFKVIYKADEKAKTVSKSGVAPGSLASAAA
jgi:hypothetical protein